MYINIYMYIYIYIYIGTEEYKKRDWLMYFKRSYVRRHDGAFKVCIMNMEICMHIYVFPMTYTVVEAYTYINICIHIYVCIEIYIYMYIYIYIYFYIYIYIDEYK
jgi:hypothetical protein